MYWSIVPTDSSYRVSCWAVGYCQCLNLNSDYEMTLSMPWRLSADTGIDAMCHAMEAFVSKKQNPFSDSLALSAISRISSSIRDVCVKPDNHAARASSKLYFKCFFND